MLVDLLPVDHFEEGLDVFRPAVLVFQVVGMLPHIQTQNRCFTLTQGVVLVRCGDIVFLLYFGTVPVGTGSSNI